MPVDAAILLLGVYVAHRENTAARVVAEIDRSANWKVDQRWIAVGRPPGAERLHAVTVESLNDLVPKFILLNRVLANLRLEDYAFVLVSDDDIVLPPGFLDNYLSIVCAYDLALSQPARTHDSYIDHPFVEQLDGLSARRTRFVEIGPLFCIRRDAVGILLPFDESSAMGWGYDLVWPCLLEAAGLKMGIVDATPVAHVIRKPAVQYDHGTADREMRSYLASRAHLARDEAFFIVDSYA